MKMLNTETMITAALVTVPADSVMPRATAARVGSPSATSFPDPGEHEDVVVHR
ncbi:hypothetical protein ACIG87_10750 [Micromonospora sp. NPDC051925]|uniref:hypothetical protein n=1 Tax=Micromonospora sp. NPDC051925 TaxID=3364288 RepID=UPI0037C5F379